LVQPELYRVLDFWESPRQLAQHFEPEVRSCADGGFGGFGVNGFCDWFWQSWLKWLVVVRVFEFLL